MASPPAFRVRWIHSRMRVARSGRGEEGPVPRFVYVTSSERRDVFERLSAEFATTSDIQVIQDRRRGERRRSDAGTSGGERRGRDRRGHNELEQELRSVGSFIAAAEDTRSWQ